MIRLQDEKNDGKQKEIMMDAPDILNSGGQVLCR